FPWLRLSSHWRTHSYCLDKSSTGNGAPQDTGFDGFTEDRCMRRSRPPMHPQNGYVTRLSIEGLNGTIIMWSSQSILMKKDLDRCRCHCGCKKKGAEVKGLSGRTFRLALCKECSEQHEPRQLR